MGPDKGQDFLESSLRRVRLERIAKHLELGVFDTDKIKAPSKPAVKKAVKTAMHAPEPKLEKSPDKPSIPRKPGAISAKKTQKASAIPQGEVQGRVMTSQDVEAEIILRRLIAMESSWQDMQPYAWDIFDKFGTAEVAGKMIELAYLHGSMTEVADLLLKLKAKNRAGYFTVGADLRPYIVLKLWSSGKEGVLNHYLHQKPFSGQLLRIEKLFVFWSLYGCADQVKAWKFLKQYKDDIFSAVKEYGSHLKLKFSLIYLEVGKLAKRLGKDQEAISYLEKIRQGDEEFDEALKLLLSFRVEVDSEGYCLFGRQLINEQDWRARLKLLESFFDKVSSQQGMRHRERTALNNLLEKPLRWFPESAEAWNRLSLLLVRYNDLDHLLPNLFFLFQAKQLDFHAPIFERALWEPLLDAESIDPFKKSYWRGIALVHKFVGKACADENMLWQAKELIEKSCGSSSVPEALPWEKIHAGLVRWVSRTAKLDEAQRQDVLGRIKIIGHHLDITNQDIEAYISQRSSPLLATIGRLQDMIQKRDDPLTEMHLILKKGQLSHLTNSDLDRLWNISRDLKDHDLGWRISSILFHRKVLSREVEQVWILSGEKRKDRFLRVIPPKLIPLIYKDFAKQDRDFAQAFLMIGDRIPELLSYINPRVRPVRTPSDSAFTDKVTETLMKHEWFSTNKKVYSSHPEFLTFSTPPFAEFIPDTPWVTVFLKLAERLGPVTWRWQISWLHHEIEGLVPKIHKANDQKLNGKVGKWMRSLSPLQRKAWFNLVSLSGRYENEEGFLVIGKILARLSCCIYQDHVGALQSLGAMNVPLAILWDLEGWISSPHYSELRKNIQTFSTFTVPAGTPRTALTDL